MGEKPRKWEGGRERNRVRARRGIRRTERRNRPRLLAGKAYKLGETREAIGCLKEVKDCGQKHQPGNRFTTKRLPVDGSRRGLCCSENETKKVKGERRNDSW